MLFGCSPCGCGPCPRCSKDCLSITFSGFAGTGVNCSECDYLDDFTVVAKRKQGTPSFVPGVNTTTGSGAQLEASLSQNETTGAWTLGSVTVKNDGSGYMKADTFKFSAANSYTEAEPQVSLVIEDSPPTLSATASGGTGASLQVAVQQIGTTGTYEITGVSVSAGGINHPDDCTLSIKSNGATTTKAVTKVTVGRQQPELWLSVESETGFGFIGSVTLEQFDDNGRPSWRIDEISIDEQGYGYQESDVVDATVIYGQEVSEASLSLEVDEYGAVAGVAVSNGGSYFRSSGVIESVAVTSGGVYQGIDGTIVSATVTNPGLLWFSAPGDCDFCCHEYEFCAACPENAGHSIRVLVTHGEADSTVLVQRITNSSQHTILRAVKTRSEGESACDGLEFSPGDVEEGCYANGTITIAEADCEQTSDTPCGLPEQITLTIAGIAPVFEWSSQNGGDPSMNGWGNGNLFNGQCDAPQAGILIRNGGNAFGPMGYSLGQTIANGSIVLDRQPGCEITYSGVGQFLPRAGGNVAAGFGIDCKHSAIVATASVSPTAYYAAVTISAPTKGDNLVNAAAEATALSGTSIAGITVTESGDGYAVEVLERSEPTVKATVQSSNGSGCELSVTLVPLSTTKGQETWTVSSMTVDSPGSGYLPEDFISLDAGDGVEELPFYGAIVLDRSEPVVSASAPGGSASLSVTLNKTTDYQGDDVWEVASVTVDDPGGDYDSDGSLAFSLDDGVTASEAAGTFTLERVEPTVECSIVSGTGSGAAVSVTLTPSGNSWSVSAASVTAGGSGYDDGDTVSFSCTDGTENYSAYGYATFDGGVLTDVAIYDGGSYFKTTGNIDSVLLSSGGQYYATTGAVDRVDVYDGGSYYIEEPTGEVDADTPAVLISSNIGQNATAVATVDTTIGSPTFGRITGISVTNGGSEYRTTGYGWKATVSVGPLMHRAGECVTPAPYPSSGGCEDDGNTTLCPDFAQYIVHESERIATGGCPTALLSKSYKMAYRTTTRQYDDIVNAGAADYCFSGYYFNILTIADFGSGDITCTLAPA
jgi:hypothetical protein